MSLTEKELEELREGGERSRIVMETVADAVITIDEASTILSVNPAAERIFGYEARELLGSDLTMLMPEYLRRLHDEGVRRYVETGRKHINWAGVELPGLHRDGREIPLEVSFGEFSSGGRRHFTGVIRDITERKRGERRLAAQYEVSRALAESASFREAVPVILRAVCEGLGWALGALWALDRDAGVLRFVESWHAHGVDSTEFARASKSASFARGEGLPGAAWEAGEAVWVEDIATNSRFPRARLAARSDLHAAIAFPVSLRGETVAALEFFSRDVREPDEPLRAMMSHVGSQIGQVIERQRAEDERARLREEVIRVQDALLAELSTPLIPLTERIMLMPLVGALDDERARRVVETLLRGLERSRAPVAIIDITGVEVVDTHVANALVLAAQAARLLGTNVVLTGIRAGVARSLVGLGVDLAGVNTRKTLQDGIACAFKYLDEGKW